MLRRKFLTMFAVLIIGSGSAAFGQCQYSVQEIVPPSCQFGGPPPLIARGLNVHGEVVGDFADCAVSGVRHPFLWTEEDGMTVFAIPEWALRTHFMDINDHGVIAGHHILPDGIHGVGLVFDPDTDLYLEFQPKHGVGGSWANAINNSGVVAGSRTIAEQGDPWPWPQNAVIWDTNTGDVQDLGVMGFGPNSEARAINSVGDVGGWTGPTNTTGVGFLVVADGSIELLDEEWNADISTILALNDLSIAAGSVVLAGTSSSRAFVWDQHTLTIIEPPKGFTGTGTADMNNVGQVLARSGPGNLPTLWQHGVTYLLSDLVVDSVNLGIPQAINDNGQVLIRVGNTKGGLLTPVDVPVADLNYDCTVDVHDLLIMLAAWGPQPPAADGIVITHPADLNGDGIVGVADLLILLSHWTQ